MSQKFLRRTVVILACAAAFTFVAAQFSWEDDFDSGSSSPSSFSSDDSPYTLGSSDDSGGSAFGDSPAPVFGTATEQVEEANPERTAREPKAKTAKAGSGRSSRERSSEPSFASAFEGPQKTCPVCVSKRLKNRLYVENNGKVIHVCSAACIGRVKRNPQAFAKKLEKRGEQLAGL